MISEGGPKCRRHPCAFFSLRLTPAEQNYIWNRKLLAVKLALEKWRHWLEDTNVPFLVRLTAKTLSISAPLNALIRGKLSGLCFSPNSTLYSPTAQGPATSNKTPCHASSSGTAPHWNHSSASLLSGGSPLLGHRGEGKSCHCRLAGSKFMPARPSLRTCSTQVRSFAVVTLLKAHLISGHSQNQGVFAIPVNQYLVEREEERDSDTLDSQEIQGDENPMDSQGQTGSPPATPPQPSPDMEWVTSLEN